MRLSKIIIAIVLLASGLSAIAQTNTHKQKKTSNAHNDILTASDDLVGHESYKAFYGQLPPLKNNGFVEESQDEFGEDIDEDFEVPAEDLYGLSWTSEFINPYKIRIDDLPDSTWVDCRGFIFPIRRQSNNRITSDFGARRRRYHYGTDIGLKVGDSIVSVFDGTVRIVSYDAHGYGNYIVVRHNNGLESLYAHLSQTIAVENQKVKAGELIGLGGNTGRSTGPHLHFEFRFLGNPFNTKKIIDYSSETCLASNYCITKNETFKHKTDIERLKQRSYHRVRSGETLSQIARRYGITVTKLCKLNHISRTTVIRPGRTIRYQ